MTDAKKKKAGRPKKKAAEKRRQATTSLTPDLYRVAVSLGGGSVYRGLQVAVERAAGGEGMTTPHTPARVQLRRTKGWRMPPQCVKVARPTVFGNPFTVAGARAVGYGEYSSDGSKATEEESHHRLSLWCVSLFREWLTTNKDNHDPKRRAALLARLPELKGKSLACFCKLGDPCHADVLLELVSRSDQ